MQDLAGTVDAWLADGRRVVLARVVAVEGSAPREPGATMAVDDRGRVAGSVSGGCVEGAVVEEALAMHRDGRPRLLAYGISDDEAFGVGLTCGGTVRLFVEPLDPQGWWPHLREALAAARPVVLTTRVDGAAPGRWLLVEADGRHAGSLGDPELDRVVARDATGSLAAGHSGLRHYGPQGQARDDAVAVFVHPFAPPPRLVVIGAVDFSAALVRVGKVLGYRVTVCDPRAAFATTARFPEADEVVVDWPHRYLAGVGPTLGPRDAVCVLTHDHRVDVPAVVAALATDVGYLGAMGSRRTHAERATRLREAGVDDAGLDRLRSPIGIDLGARTPEEVAISIVAEIIATRTGRPVPSLRDGTGPIHPVPDPAVGLSG